MNDQQDAVVLVKKMLIGGNSDKSLALCQRDICMAIFSRVTYSDFTHKKCMLKEHFIDLLGPLYMMGNPG